MSPAVQLDLNLSRKTRDEATARALEHNRGFLELMRQRARGVSIEKGAVTSDDLRSYADAHGFKPTKSSVWGLVFREPGWQLAGHQPSAVVGNHAREIKRWKWVGVDRA